MQYASYVQSSIDRQGGLRILSAEHPDIYHGHPSLVDEHFNCAFLFTEIMRRRVGIGFFKIRDSDTVRRGHRVHARLLPVRSVTVSVKVGHVRNNFFRGVRGFRGGSRVVKLLGEKSQTPRQNGGAKFKRLAINGRCP